MAELKTKTILLQPLKHRANKLRQAVWPPVQAVYDKAYDFQTGEVHVSSRLSIEDYEQITPAADLARLRGYAAAMTGKKLVFVNATYAGGGVAIMRTPLIALLQLMGVDAHWYVMRPDEAAFLVTKIKFHNVLQDVAGPGVALTIQDKKVYERWCRTNAKLLAKPLSRADVIIVDDWQPTGLIPFIKGGHHRPGINPDAKLVFRNHIHSEGALMSTPGTPQHTTWRYIWHHNQVSTVDAMVVHPKDEFVPPDVPDAKVVFMPATSDMLDDLNRPLNKRELSEGLSFINKQLARNQRQKPINPKRPYMVLIARFDPSKGMPLGMAAYARAREKMQAEGLTKKQLPQLVIAGNGSIDDPEGLPMLQEIMRLRKDEYAAIKNDIKVVRVPHNDIALNALLRGSVLALQPSIKEGFESRVTDAILQGVPVIGSSRGGIPLQIVDGRSGYVIDPEDTEQWASRITELMTNHRQYRYMKAQALQLGRSYNYQFTTVPNAISWLQLATSLLGNRHFMGNRRWMKDIHPA